MTSQLSTVDSTVTHHNFYKNKQKRKLIQISAKIKPMIRLELHQFSESVSGLSLTITTSFTANKSLDFCPFYIDGNGYSSKKLNKTCWC